MTSARDIMTEGSGYLKSDATVADARTKTGQGRHRRNPCL